MTNKPMTQDIWEHLTEEAEQGFLEREKLENLALRRKRMINRIEGILIAVIVYMIFMMVRG